MNFDKILFDGSQIALNKYIPSKQFSFQMLSNTDQSISSCEHMSLIMIWTPGNFLKMTAHFDNKDVDGIYDESELTPEEKSRRDQKMNLYRMKEFSNLQGGFFRTLFGETSLFFGMSLPLLTSGKSEPIFNQVTQPQTKRLRWKASTNENTLFFTGEFKFDPKIVNSKRLSKLSHLIEEEKNKSLDDGGEIEFF